MKFFILGLISIMLFGCVESTRPLDRKEVMRYQLQRIQDGRDRFNLPPGQNAYYIDGMRVR